MTLFEGLIVLATFAGPIVAVRATRYLDDQKEIRERKLWVFKTLMATRAYTLAASHVEALNRIDLEFSGDSLKEKKIIATWRQYLDLLGDKSLSPEQWGVRRVDLLVELLHTMGAALGYEFDKTQIKNGTYAPVAHSRTEEEYEAIRRLTLEILQGNRAVPVSVNSLNDSDSKP